MSTQKYFISNGTSKEGPFELEELLNRTFDKKIMVWRSDFSDWKLISEVEELSNNINEEPPELPQDNIKQDNKIDWIITINIAIFIIVSVLLLMFNYLKKGESKSDIITIKTEEEKAPQLNYQYENFNDNMYDTTSLLPTKFYYIIVVTILDEHYEGNNLFPTTTYKHFCSDIEVTNIYFNEEEKNNMLNDAEDKIVKYSGGDYKKVFSRRMYISLSRKDIDDSLHLYRNRQPFPYY